MATLAQAIISTAPTAANRMNSVGRAVPVMKSCRRATSTRRPPLLVGYCCSRRSAIGVNCACACSMLTPSFKRASTDQAMVPRGS